jgi:hypothetical protein
MSKLIQLFQNIPEISPSPALEQAVLHKIEFLEGRKAKRAQVWSYAGFAGSIATFVYAIAAFGGTLAQSEFWSIISLAFSDAQIVAANWREFLYSGLETFPVVGAIAMLIPTVILLWSLSQYLKLPSYHQRKYLTH